MTLATFISTSYNVYKDSKGFLFSGLSGAVINIILNFVFIPLFGIYGAALATACSYIAVFIYRVFDTRKYVKMHFNLKHLLLLLLVLISCIVTYLDTYIGIIWCIIAVILVVAYYRDVVFYILNAMRKKLRSFKR